MDDKNKQTTSNIEVKEDDKKVLKKEDNQKKSSIKTNSSNIKIFERKSNKFFENKTPSTDLKTQSKSLKANKQQATSEFEEKIVAVKKISKTTKGGRNMRFSALAVIGNKKGLVGFGIGKSIEVPVAIKKALKDARNNMFKIKMNKKNTVYHEVIGKHGAGKVLVKPAQAGKGIIAGGPIKIVLELAGFKDVYSKNLGRNTALNMVRATVNGLLQQKTPKEFAKLRDKELKDL